MSDTVPGRWFMWMRGLSSLTPCVYHDGYPKRLSKDIAFGASLTEEEAKLPIEKLVTRYPMSLCYPKGTKL